MHLLLKVVLVIAMALVQARPFEDRSGNFMLLKIPATMKTGYSVVVKGLLKNISPTDEELPKKRILAYFPGESGETITISYEFTAEADKMAITMNDVNNQNEPIVLRSENYSRTNPDDSLAEFDLKLSAAVNNDQTHRFDIIYDHNWTGPINTDTSVSKLDHFNTVLINEDIATVTSLLFELNTF